MTDPDTDVLNIAESWQANGHAAALGTVIATWGSSPRQPGSQIAVRDDGAFAGSVSAGCVEGAVIEAAQETLHDGKCRRLKFGVSDETAWSAGLTCGGQIEILVEAADAAALRALNVLLRQDKRAVRAVVPATGEARLVDPSTDRSPLGLAAAAAARSGRSTLAVIEEREWFLCVYNPPVDLVAVGAVHITQVLAAMSPLLGFRLRVIDPRASFATPERFPGVPLACAYPDEALQAVPLKPNSAVVTLAHDPKIDDPALETALRSPAFYVGALGSQQNQTARLDRLKARGFTAGELARLHGPVGLPIGSKSPPEIALSILAQIVAVQRLAV
jgi:xanthine dehydrogenase accessory factor